MAEPALSRDDTGHRIRLLLERVERLIDLLESGLHASWHVPQPARPLELDETVGVIPRPPGTRYRPGEMRPDRTSATPGVACGTCPVACCPSDEEVQRMCGGEVGPE